MNSTISTTVTFESDAFNTTLAKDYFINPDCYGDDLCRWLIAKLKEAGVECDDEPGQEDFGWYFNYRVTGRAHCFVCGCRPGDGLEPGVWIGWIERCAGFISSIFGGRNKGIAPGAARCIHEALSTAPEISSIRWHYKQDFDCGDESSGRSDPGD